MTNREAEDSISDAFANTSIVPDRTAAYWIGSDGKTRKLVADPVSDLLDALSSSPPNADFELTSGSHTTKVAHIEIAIGNAGIRYIAIRTEDDIP